MITDGEDVNVRDDNHGVNDDNVDDDNDDD